MCLCVVTMRDHSALSQCVVRHIAKKEDGAATGPVFWRQLCCTCLMFSSEVCVPSCLSARPSSMDGCEVSGIMDSVISLHTGCIPFFCFITKSTKKSILFVRGCHKGWLEVA